MEAVGRLAGGIAHDFNNMLTSIIGNASLLELKMEKDSPLKVFVEQILSSAEKSTSLTRQLLAFSSRQIIAAKETGLNELMENMKKLLLRLIGEDVELKIQLSDEPLTVIADPSQIDQVLMNLCINASDAMPDGGLLSIGIAQVNVHDAKTYGLGKPGMYACITVTDSGVGMDESTRLKIFEPFFTTKEPGKGTSLGLSIAHGIIKQHDGNIMAYSEPGKGTTFKIYLPLVKSRLPETKTREVVTPKGGTETILLTEDDEEVRDVTRHVLEEFGYTVIEAEDGEDAVIKFKEYIDRIQLVMLDVIMPKKNGKIACDEIKKIKPDVMVLFTSGYPADLIQKKGMCGERIDFIQKPAAPNMLLAKVRDILDGKCQENGSI